MNSKNKTDRLRAAFRNGTYRPASGDAIVAKLERLPVRDLNADQRAMLTLPERLSNRQAVNRIRAKSGGTLRGIRNAAQPKSCVEPLTFRVSDRCAPVRPLWRCRTEAIRIGVPVFIPVTPPQCEALMTAAGIPGYMAMESESLPLRLKRQRLAWWIGTTVLQLTLATLYLRGVLPTAGFLTCLMLSTLFLASLRSRFRC